MAEEDGLLGRLMSPMTAQSLVAVLAPRAVAPLVNVFGGRGLVKIESMGQVGWLPRVHLAAARVVDPELRLVE